MVGNSELSYKPLAESFEGRSSQRGWVFTLMEREDRVCLYEKVSGEGIRYWEVIVLHLDKGGDRVIWGKVVHFEAKERYPSDEEFGQSAWSYGRYEDALKKYEGMVGRSRAAQ